MAVHTFQTTYPIDATTQNWGQGMCIIDGEIYISGAQPDSILVFDKATLEHVRTLSVSAPSGLAPGLAEGVIIVASAENDHIRAHSTVDGSLISPFASCSNPWQIMWNAGKTELYVTCEDNKVRVFDSTGNPVREWGSLGTGDGQFAAPWGIWVTSDEVYVTDSDYTVSPYSYRNDRVQVFQHDGTFLRSWGTEGTAHGQLDNPRGICVIGDLVYVVDGLNDRIEVFTKSGIFLESIAESGSGDDQLDDPTGILPGSIYVADTGNVRVSYYTAAAPGAEPVASATLTQSGRTITVTDTSSPCEWVTVQWGDASSDSVIAAAGSASHTYQDATAIYTVTVIAASDGQADTTTYTVDVAGSDQRSILTTILSGRDVQVAYRVLTTELIWPAGEPPYTSGEYVQVPDMPVTPAEYDPSTFDAAAWTDVTALVSEYVLHESAGMGISQLSLSVPVGWLDSLRDVFQEMRVVKVQERYYSPDGDDTGWMDVFFGISDGYQETFDNNLHSYTVNVRDVLKLANIEILGAERPLVFEPDKIKHGTYADRFQLTLVATTTDAYEYAIIKNEDGSIQFNWADRPAPQFWVTNRPGSTGPIPLVAGGSGVQAVFGDGILRISKQWITEAPGEHDDFTAGLGWQAAWGDPEVAGVVYRFAHIETVDRTNTWCRSDVETGLTVTASGSGYVVVDSDLYFCPAGLTLIADDGTERRWQTTTLSKGTNSTIYLSNTSEVIPVGTKVRYGDAALVTDFARRLCLTSGFQTIDSSKPFYVDVSTPTLNGSSKVMWFPPLVYDKSMGSTPYAALEELRQQGYITVNYLARATRSGQVVVESVGQKASGSAEIIPVSTPVPPVQIERSDIQAYTRVVARGLRRQIQDLCRPLSGTVTVSEVTSADGGIPEASANLAIQYQHRRTDYSYLIQQAPASIECADRRARGWRCNTSSSTDAWRFADQWCDKAVVEITLPAVAQINAVELDVTSPPIFAFQRDTWWVLRNRNNGFADGSRNYVYHIPNRRSSTLAKLDLQSLGVQYLDGDAWRPLVSEMSSTWTFPEVLRVESDWFDTRCPVWTNKVRIVCNRPQLTQTGTYDEDWWYAAVEVYLSSVKLWTSPELEGVATIGTTAPFTGNDWQAVYARMRRRTEVLSEAAPWAFTQDDVDALAAEWLKYRALDLAPRRLKVVRPDLRVWDTVSLTLPGGESIDYLCTDVTHSLGQVDDIVLSSYSLPYYQ